MPLKDNFYWHPFCLAELCFPGWLQVRGSGQKWYQCRPMLGLVLRLVIVLDRDHLQLARDLPAAQKWSTDS